MYKMKSLQLICLHKLSPVVWHSLCPSLQALLITDGMRSSFITLQRSILHRARQRMEKIVTLLTEQFSVDLVPSNAVRYNVREAVGRIKPGDHLVVMVGGIHGYGHHGLYLGFNNDCFEVAEFGSDTGNKTDNIIRIISYSDFSKGVEYVYIVPYTEDSKLTRCRSIELARTFVKCKDLHKYNVLTWNCETFVLMCKSGQYCYSDQIVKLFEAIHRDIHHQESIIGNTMMVVGRSSKQCIVS